MRLYRCIAVLYLLVVVGRRYFNCQGLFDVPARITIVIAPLNAFLNWYFGALLAPLQKDFVSQYVSTVYPLGLSFRGAPIATALSLNLASIASIAYAYYCVPRTAWIPIGRGVWRGWGLLSRLGIAGISEFRTYY